MVPVHHRTAQIDGLEVFFREAGPAQAPAVVLLHGFPSSSFMFRELIPLLADRYYVVAPDMIGYGSSAAPPTDSFSYTFDALADVTAKLLDHLKIKTYAFYMHDYGAPVGLRLALRDPDRISGIITQSGNAYMDGFGEKFWAPLFAYAKDPGPETEPGVARVLTPDTTRWQFYHGVPDPTLVSPDGWQHAQSIIDRPGNVDIQKQLVRDYKTNLDLYPTAQQYFRNSNVPLLAVWGRNDEIFVPPGATAFQRDLPDAEIHLIDAGHFALESHLDVIAGYVRGFLGRTLP
ncbi:alpha/beta fold hydrolase [Micromonospora sp. 4G55]|uniref:alpha/beta fold hydrolase n=1 Tax=Micromonospora sp. 4G55 TaxID=2806102 RepID=UPI001A477CE7|nr:alpha/beta hydrolase [Micromonospora sp. 4G55]MBM0256054.1 alpha/beta hydrolase [Micromonospora sp. 4G55]